MNLLSRKLVMGLASILGVAFSHWLGIGDSAIYVLGSVAVISVGGQSVVDALTAWFGGKPFVLEKTSCVSSAPSSPSA